MTEPELAPRAWRFAAMERGRRRQGVRAPFGNGTEAAVTNFNELHPRARVTVDQIVLALAGCPLLPGERERAVDRFVNEIASQAFAEGLAAYAEDDMVPTWWKAVANAAAEIREHALARLALCDGTGAGRA